LVASRRNVFITGAAGTGKSHVLRAALERAPCGRGATFLTAPTGLAAAELGPGGMTLNAFAGVGRVVAQRRGFVPLPLQPRGTLFLKGCDPLSCGSPATPQTRSQHAPAARACAWTKAAPCAPAGSPFSRPHPLHCRAHALRRARAAMVWFQCEGCGDTLKKARTRRSPPLPRAP
jgi:hypothetical protein